MEEGHTMWKHAQESSWSRRNTYALCTKQAHDQPKPLSVPPWSLIYFEEKFPQTHSPSSWQRASGGKTLGRKKGGNSE